MFDGLKRLMRRDLAMEAPGSPSRTIAADPVYRSSSLSSQDLAGYIPPIMSGDTASLWNQRLTQDRVNDLARNDPVAVAAVNRLMDLLVGPGLNLSARPSAAALGISRKEAREIGRTIETEWEIFWNDPLKRADFRRRLTGNGIFRQAARTMVRGDEACAVLRWRQGTVPRYRTAVQPVDPDRLKNPYGAPNSVKLRGGVEFDDDQAPIAYHVTEAHPADYFAGALMATWTRIPAATAWGRPIFIHAYEPEREDQTRAMSKFAALVGRLRMITRGADTELAASAANALFAAFISSSLSVTDATEMLTPTGKGLVESRDAARAKFYGATHPTINGVRIPVLPVGDKIEFNDTPRQTTAFPQFQTAFLQSIAAALGISYEQLSMDWTKTNYSSARAALNEVWRAISRLLAVFVDQYVTPVYYAFLEEAIDRGYVQIPGGLDTFHAMPGAVMRARWIGPGRGYIDPETEADATQKRLNSLTSTLEDEWAEQGRDLEEGLDQIEIEEEMLAERGLTRQTVSGAMPGQATAGANGKAATRAAKEIRTDATSA